MSDPTREDVKRVLDSLEWKSDAEKRNLPLVNTHDRDAPTLDVDAVLRRSERGPAGGAAGS